MLFACIITNILAIALPSLRISPLLLIRIATIALLYAAALSFSVVYIQSIGFGIGFFSELFHVTLLSQSIFSPFDSFFEAILSGENWLLLSSLLPVAPHDDKPSGKLTKAEKAALSLPDKLQEILVGLLLGDLNAQKQKGAINARLCFAQGLVHETYLLHLYGLFELYCSTGPKLVTPPPDKRTGKVYFVTRFQTCSLPCFTKFYNLFYPYGQKLVPLNIADLLTPLGLAYWISDDGCFDKTNGVIILCTESFSLIEVELLQEVLVEKFKIGCAINKQKGIFRIRIHKKSLPVVQALLKDILPPMMLYKIGL